MYRTRIAKSCALTLVFFSTAINAIAIDLTSCGILNQAGVTYVLQNDVSSSSTCFAIQADNITLDLNGHTIVYGSAPVITVPNGNFENGTGAAADSWDQSQAPNASRIAGTFVQPVQVSSGSYSIAFALPADHQYIKSPTISLEGGRRYLFSAMYYNQLSPAVTAYIELDNAADDTLLSSTTIIGRTWRGFQYFGALYSPSQNTNVYIKLGVTGTLSSAGNVYMDDVRLTIGPCHGILAQACWATEVYDNACGGSAAYTTIKNGIIRQGASGGFKSHGIFFNQINHADNSEIYGTTIVVHGPASINIAAGYHNTLKIHDNVLISSVTVISNRDAQEGVLIEVGNGMLYANRDLVYGNKLIGGAQLGIKVGSDYSEIYNNDISQNSYYSNDFSIMVNADNCDIHDNVVHTQSGRGIRTGNAGNRVYNNNITVTTLKRNQEYNGCPLGGAYGIQLEDPATDNLIYGNTILAVNTVCAAQGIKLTGLAPNSNNKISTNTIRASGYSSDDKSGAITFSGGFHSGVTIANNILTSDQANVHISRNGGSEAVFSSNTYIRGPSPAADYATIYFNNDVGASTGTVILDGIFQDGAAIASTHTHILSVYKSEELFIKWTVRIKAQDGSAQPVTYADVAIQDNNGQTVFNGQTDAQGYVSAPLFQYRLYNTAGAAGNIENLTPHTVSISKAGHPTSNTSLTADSTKTVTVVMSNDSTPPAAPRGFRLN